MRFEKILSGDSFLSGFIYFYYFPPVLKQHFGYRNGYSKLRLRTLQTLPVMKNYTGKTLYSLHG
jgi:hypothetical protein